MKQNIFDGFEKTVSECMQLGDIPGVVVGVVDRSGTRYSGGFGLANVERGASPNDQTRFCIQSCTKGFTAMVVAAMVEDHVVEWDRPIRSYVPGFRMCDATAAEAISFRDILAHRAGLPAGHDWMRITSSLTRQELLDRLPHLEPNRPLRAAFQYSNLMYVIVGALVERITGVTWEEFVRRRILEPLRMADSDACGSVGDDDANAMPDYSRNEHGRVRFSALWEPPLLQTLLGATSAPCGGVVSTIHDLCAWVQFQLGSHGLSRAEVSLESLHALHAVQIHCPAAIREPETGDGGVAMGWFVQSYRGQRLVAHWGGGFGPTVCSFMPEAGVGVCVHSNRAASSFHAINAIMLNAYDRMLGLEPLPLVDRWTAQMATAASASNPPSPADTVSVRVPGGAAGLAGRYAHPGYGTIEIQAEPTGICLHYQGLRFDLHQGSGDGLDMLLNCRVPDVLKKWWGLRRAMVVRSAEGTVESVALPFEPAVKDIMFARQPS